MALYKETGKNNLSRVCVCVCVCLCVCVCVLGEGGADEAVG